MERQGSSFSYLLDLLFVLAEKAKTEADIEKLNKLNLAQFNLSFKIYVFIIYMTQMSQIVAYKL